MSTIIGIQGQPGSYTEEVALSVHPNANLHYYETFSDTLKALHNEEIESAIMAIANNRIGFIGPVYDPIRSSGSNLTIVGEAYLPVNHALLGLPNAKLTDITEVHSQSEALDQCTVFLETQLPQAHPIIEHDTAGSAKLVAETADPRMVAIASERAGQLYGLEPLAQSIQDDQNNITRFVEVKLRNGEVPVISEANKTSVVMTTGEKAGALVDILTPFKEARITLTDLQSAIIPNSPFHNEFFVEFHAGLSEDRTKQVLDKIKATGCKVQILGSYPAGQIPYEAQAQ